MTAQHNHKLQFEQLLPAFCQGHIVLRVLVLAQTVALLLALGSPLSSDFWARLGLISIFVHWVALLTVALLCRFQHWLYRCHPVRLVLIALTLLQLVTFAVTGAAFSITQGMDFVLELDFTDFALHTSLIALLVGGLGLQFFNHYVQHSQRLAAQSRSEFDALQARIRPHFLFNSLNTAAELTHLDPRAAEQALLDLAALFRAALNAGTQVSLQEELALARSYLTLEQWRLGARLRLDWQISADCPALMLPCLTIQPLFENAIRHGIEPTSQPGWIHCQLLCSKRHVTLLITNSVLESQGESTGNGVALQNIRRRLELQFGDDATLTTRLADQKFRVKLVLPVKEAKELA